MAITIPSIHTAKNKGLCVDKEDPFDTVNGPLLVPSRSSEQAGHVERSLWRTKRLDPAPSCIANIICLGFAKCKTRESVAVHKLGIFYKMSFDYLVLRRRNNIELSPVILVETRLVQHPD